MLTTAYNAYIQAHHLLIQFQAQVLMMVLNPHGAGGSGHDPYLSTFHITQRDLEWYVHIQPGRATTHRIVHVCFSIYHQWLEKEVKVLENPMQ